MGPDTRAQSAAAFIERGWSPVPIPADAKGPIIAGWQKGGFEADDFVGAGNIGLLNGEPSSGLVNVDLDCPEAVQLAPDFLPPTGMVHGRASKRRSHWWYQATGTVPKSVRHKDVLSEDRMSKKVPTLVEMQSTGTQTVVPPSRHPEGEPYEWDADGEPAAVDGDELARCVACLWAACLLARHWPGEGSRHDCANATAGFLLNGGLDRETVVRIVEGAARAAGDDEVSSRVRAAEATADNHERGKPITGGPTLADLVGEKVVAKLTEKLGLRRRWGAIVPADGNTSVPEGYKLYPTHVAKSECNAKVGWFERKVAEAPIVVTSRLIDVDTGEESLRLSWSRGGKQSLVVGRGKLMDARSLVELASVGFPVNSVNARDIVEYLTAFEAHNLEKLPVEWVSSHMGWQGKGGEHGFLWGRELIADEGTTPVAFKGADGGDEQIADGYHASGTLEGWIEGVSAAQDYPMVLFDLYAAFVPPLLGILGCPNFAVDTSNRTSTGKSTSKRVAASVVGNPERVIRSWDTTRVGFERFAGVARDLPLFLDDTKQAKKAETVGEILYDHANGYGRGRGSKEGLARTASWDSVLLSTGEGPAVEFTKDGGTRARVLTLKGMPFGSDNAREVVEQLNAAVGQHYGHALPLFVRCIQAHRDEWPKWRATYERGVTNYAKLGGTAVAGRLAKYFAAVAFTGRMVHKAFEEAGYLLPWKPLTFEHVWKRMAIETVEAAPDIRALHDVYNWAAQHRRDFWDGTYKGIEAQYAPSSGWLGRWDDGDGWTCITFQPLSLRAFLTSQGYRPDEVLEGWKSRGWVETDPEGKLKKVRIDGPAVRAVTITRETFHVVEGAEEAA